MTREEQGDKDDPCFWPSCGKPARQTIDIGDDAGPALRRVCDDCLKERFEEEQ